MDATQTGSPNRPVFDQHPLPNPIAKARKEECGGCSCAVNFFDPCAECPKGKWAKVFCNERPAPTVPAGAIVETTRLPPDGTGTQLKRMLGKLGINPVGPCKCNARATEMDFRGPDWCEENIETIVDWLREESERRKLPFLAPAARMLVKLAIRKARKMQG